MQKGNKTINIILIILLILGLFYGYSYFKVDLDYNMFNGKLREELSGRRIRIDLSEKQIREIILEISNEYKTINITNDNIQIMSGSHVAEKILIIKWQYTYDLPMLKSTRNMIIERTFRRTRDS